MTSNDPYSQVKDSIDKSQRNSSSEHEETIKVDQMQFWEERKHSIKLEIEQNNSVSTVTNKQATSKVEFLSKHTTITSALSGTGIDERIVNTTGDHDRPTKSTIEIIATPDLSQTPETPCFDLLSGIILYKTDVVSKLNKKGEPKKVCMVLGCDNLSVSYKVCASHHRRLNALKLQSVQTPEDPAGSEMTIKVESIQGFHGIDEVDYLCKYIDGDPKTQKNPKKRIVKTTGDQEKSKNNKKKVNKLKKQQNSAATSISTNVTIQDATLRSKSSGVSSGAKKTSEKIEQRNERRCWGTESLRTDVESESNNSNEAVEVAVEPPVVIEFPHAVINKRKMKRKSSETCENPDNNRQYRTRSSTNSKLAKKQNCLDFNVSYDVSQVKKFLKNPVVRIPRFIPEHNEEKSLTSTCWGSQANSLLERLNKNSPDDWERLQTDRENLAKMLQNEKDQHKKTFDEIQQMKHEKTKVDSEIANLQQQLTASQADSKKLSEEIVTMRQESIKMSQELLELKEKSDLKDDEMKKLSEKLASKETQLQQLKEKDQFLEQQKNQGMTRGSGDVIMAGEASTSAAGEIETKVAQLQQKIDAIRMENGKLQQQNNELRKAIQKEESSKTLLAQLKREITQITKKLEDLDEPQQQQRQKLDNYEPSTCATGSSSHAPILPTHHHASSTMGLNKRSRDVEGDSSTANDDASDKLAPQKRPKVQEGSFQVNVSESGLEFEYQVLTSSQRNQRNDAIVLSSEDIDEIQSSANSEVEIDDISEKLNQSVQPVKKNSTSRENQQQIQSISSGSSVENGGEEAGPSTSVIFPSATFQSCQSPKTLHQQTQHSMLMSQTFQDEASDDRIVPSTPTLYVSRNDDFSEVVSSPHPAQVSHAAACFTFGESSSSSSSSHPMAIVRIDETRIDDDDNDNGPSRMPQQQIGDNIVNDSASATTSSTSSSTSTVVQQDIQQEQPVAGSSSQKESQVPEISITRPGDDYDGASTSETRDKTGNIEYQDIDGGDVRNSDDENPPASKANDKGKRKSIMVKHRENRRTTKSSLVMRGANPPKRRSIREWICKQCKISFASKYSADRHKERKHGEYVKPMGRPPKTK